MNPLHQQINELEQLAAELHDYPGYSWAIDRIRRVVEDLERFEEPDRCAVDHFGDQLRSWRKHGHSFQTADDVIEFMITSFVEELP